MRVPLVLPRAAVVKTNHHKCEAIAKDPKTPKIFDGCMSVKFWGGVDPVNI